MHFKTLRFLLTYTLRILSNFNNIKVYDYTYHLQFTRILFEDYYRIFQKTQMEGSPAVRRYDVVFCVFLHHGHQKNRYAGPYHQHFQQ